MNHILVVGGAGYIGSHMVKLLLRKGYEVTTLDNLSTGYRDSVVGGHFVCGDVGNAADLEPLFNNHRFSAVMHFAACSQVGESVQKPSRYYQNNVANTLTLLDTMLRHKVGSLVFSSTAAIFGEPQYSPIDEQHPKQPINPYGRSKWFVEQILSDYDAAYGLKSISLRYFNAAGADPEGDIGERHDPETHLIPLVLQTASGRRQQLNIFGTDFDTPDGTCVRDYIHVEDLCSAHWLALNALLNGHPSTQFNLGNGCGYSVQQVLRIAEQVSSKPIAATKVARREGDPAVLVADSAKAVRELHWTPAYPALTDIIRHGWAWEQALAEPIQPEETPE